MSAPTKDQVIELLESIGRLLELKGENVFKIRAYTNAARAIETFRGDLGTALAEGTLREIPGIGQAIADKLAEFLETGRLEYFETLRGEFPAGLFELFELQGLGAKKIKALYEALGVDSIASLEKALAAGSVAELPGFGAKTASNLVKAIDEKRRHAGAYRFGEAATDAERMLAELRDLPEVLQTSIAGSYRRRKEIVRDLDFIVASSQPDQVTEFFTTHPLVESIIAKGPTKSSVRWRSGIQADLRVVSNEQYPYALNYFTGSKEHNIVMRQRALERGWTLNEYRLGVVEEGKSAKKAGATPPVVRTEDELYAALGLEYVEPELRENLGEIEAAEEHQLPDLVRVENLRGTFHNHTTESDGRSTLEEMVEAAQELGLAYLGIADHSKSSFQAHGLDASRLLAQRARIAELNASMADFRIFAGTECDILKGGELDFPDEVLSQLDYVVASIHAGFTASEAEMTARIIRAVENPYVTMLGHLTGRLLLTREPYAVNIPAVIDACAATGTIIELNASPKRLDMDWRWWRLAKEKGVRCSINPDAHHVSHLNFLWFGTGIARKGWLTKGDVVNCLSLAEIEAELRKKRERLAK